MKEREWMRPYCVVMIQFAVTASGNKGSEILREKLHLMECNLQLIHSVSIYSLIQLCFHVVL